MGWRLVGLAVLTLMLTGCGGYSWVGESAITLNDGSVQRCASIWLHHHYVTCGHGKNERMIGWEHIAGIRMGATR